MTTKTKPLSSKFKKAKVDEPSALAQTERDFKDAIMTVSVFVNLFVLCLWVAVQMTTQYDTALVNYFITR